MGTMDSVEIQNRDDEITDKQKLVSGDILIKRLNHSFAYVVAPEYEGAVASQNLLVIRPRENIDPFYLGYLLEQKEIIGQVLHVTGNTAAIKAISIKKLADITVPLISKEEQTKVGEVWRLSRKRKQLLNEYMAEGDRLVSMMASKIINGGGKER